MSRLTAVPARIGREVAVATGPWPVARLVRAALALAVASLLAGWVAGTGERIGEVLALPAFAGVVVLAAAVVSGRTRPVGKGLLLLGAPAALLAVDAPATTAATIGITLVAVLELSRWSVERRVEVPGERAGERRRWLHLVAVLAAGWLVGSGTVGLASGRIDLASWQAVLAGIAALAVAAAVAWAARLARA